MTTKPITQLFDLTAKGAIVTGGSMGIGKGIALRLAEAGASVMITDIDMETANQTVEEIKARGGKAQAIYADARKVADAQKATQASVEAFGSLDILINNAGVYPFTPTQQISEKLWDKILDTNLKGMFFYSQAAAQEMIRAGRGGRIVNIASMNSFRPAANLAHYNISKSGVVMLTRALALELAPNNILVNAVAPGCVTTPGTDEASATLISRAQADGISISAEELKKSAEARIPLRRWGEPDDIAKVMLFLVSAAADYMTGTVVLVDGGYLLA